MSIKMRAVLFGALALLAGVFGASDASAQAKWGAIAYSDSWHVSRWNSGTEADAGLKAMQDCNAKFPGKCTLKTFSGESCMALTTQTANGKPYSWWTIRVGFAETQRQMQLYCAKAGPTCKQRTLVCANGRH